MRRLKPRSLMHITQLSCATFFTGDVAYDLLVLKQAGTLPDLAEILYLAFEGLAAAFLVVSLWMGVEYERALRSIGDDKDSTLSALRACFDDLINARFDQWALSQAERDVALLAFRGLRISEIAELRGTREGTVKAQMSSVFHKAGVTTRAEFLALFMDEFLDFGVASAVSDTEAAPGPARPDARPDPRPGLG